MNLDDLLKPVVSKTPPKILTLDIERFKGRAEIEFWDLSDYKHRRIHPSDVTEWPRTICAAWRWYGGKRVEFAAEWENAGRDGMLKRLWDCYHQADIIVGHNVQAFDTKKLRSEWLLMGLGPPSPSKYVDTLKVFRSVFGLESNTLDSILTRLGLQGKTDRYDVETARLALGGNKAAQRRLRAYNVGDIEASELLYDRIRPWIPSHPNIGLWSGEDRVCPNCGSEELEASGWARTALTAYAQYLCQGCGTWLRANHVKARVGLRPVR